MEVGLWSTWSCSCADTQGGFKLLRNEGLKLAARSNTSARTVTPIYVWHKGFDGNMDENTLVAQASGLSVVMEVMEGYASTCGWPAEAVNQLFQKSSTHPQAAQRPNLLRGSA